MHEIQKRVDERLGRGFSPTSALSHSMAEATKAEAAEYATRMYGVEVRKSWTMRQIIVATTTEAAH